MSRGSEHTAYERVALGRVTIGGREIPAHVELRVAKDEPRSPVYGDDVRPVGFVDEPASIALSVTVQATIPGEDLYDWIVNGDWTPHVHIPADEDGT